MQDDIISVDVFHDVFDVAFFPYVNLIESFDLACYQIYHEVVTENYTPDSFSLVYSLMMRYKSYVV